MLTAFHLHPSRGRAAVDEFSIARILRHTAHTEQDFDFV
jgi:hypothetical protein